MTDPKRPESLDEAIEAVTNRLDEVTFGLFGFPDRRRERASGLQDALDVLRAERERRRTDADRP